MPQNPADLPEHVAETVGAVQELHLRHAVEASRFELLAERIAGTFGQPAFLAAFSGVVALWIGTAFFAQGRGMFFQLSPLEWLELLLTLFAVYATLLILAGQRRQERLANHREKLTLQLALLNEQKGAKIIALLEEFRRDSPQIADRDDPEADAMAAKVDPQQVSDAIKQIENE